jgi:lipopolysaccharide/colanic/teichoic acid biosynthesis glycosyltransferase
MGDMPLINFNPIHAGKRLFDVLFSLIVLIVLTPVLIFIAIAIKLEDMGPVFYGHRRITASGKEFNCWKFRTMCNDADKKLEEILSTNPQAKKEWELSFKLKNDPRITWVGKILRKTSFDELPQFFNVLVGDMSVVGARPIVVKEMDDYYKECAGIYCSIKPGITGPWQVGKRSDVEDYDQRIKLDTQYIMNPSFWLDLKIIFKTVICMVSGKGAY